MSKTKMQPFWRRDFGIIFVNENVCVLIKMYQNFNTEQLDRIPI